MMHVEEYSIGNESGLIPLFMFENEVFEWINNEQKDGERRKEGDKRNAALDQIKEDYADFLRVFCGGVA